MLRPLNIIGYAVVSADGMIANAAGVMPDSLKFDADQRFYERGLDAADLVVHGRYSREHQPQSNSRHRLILTRNVPGIAIDSTNQRALFWNPQGASFEEAMSGLGQPSGTVRKVAIIGGTEVFGTFLDRYTAFHLSQVSSVRLPGGRPVFPGVPARTPEDILASHGLRSDGQRQLGPSAGLSITSWYRP